MLSNYLLQNLIQQITYSLATSILLLYLTTLPKRSIFFSAMTFMTLLLLVNVPISKGSSLVEILRGGVGDVSITSLALMILLLRKTFEPEQSTFRILQSWEKSVLVIVGLILYTSTFGFIQIDVYHFGYISEQMIAIFSLIVFVLIILNRRIGYVWLIAYVSFYFHLQQSNNLWDYLYDPILWLILFSEMILKLSSYNSGIKKIS